MSRLIRSATILFCILSAAAGLTTEAQQQSLQPALDDILEHADRATDQYVETFKNLLSEETKIVEAYDKKGEVKKRTTIRSTFIVYQLVKDENQVTEFRNVLSVDGKTVENADKRAQDFFAKIVNAESSSKEIEQLKKESSRYDGDLVISGLTLFQSPVLSKELRPFFDFRLAGVRSVDGFDVYEIVYKQIKPTPLISINSRESREPGKRRFDFDVEAETSRDLNGRLRGTLWIDAATFQIRREHRELTVQPGGASAPMPAIINDLDFQGSEFGILTPKKITHAQFRIRDKGEAPVKVVAVTMEYSKFSKPDVEVKSSEVKRPPKP